MHDFVVLLCPAVVCLFVNVCLKALPWSTDKEPAWLVC